MKKSWIGGLLLVAIALIPLVPFAKSQQKTAPAIPVEVTHVTTMTIPKEITAIGSLSASQMVTISSEVDGRVAKIYFKDGQKVGKGVPIIQLDNAQAQADYDAAVTALKLSRAKYNRAKLLIAQGAISEQALQQLKADAESKEADVKSQLAALNQKQLTAPFTGLLGSFKVQVGDFINKGDPLVQIVNNEEMSVDYSLPEKSLPTIKKGQDVEISANAYPKKLFTGIVNFISPTIDPDTRSVDVKALVSNKKSLLTSGMFVTVTQMLGETQNALVIPEQALMASVKGFSVYKVVDGRAVLTVVKVGVRVQGKAEIISGLAVNDVVVIAGQQKLQDGRRVKIVKGGS